MIKLSKIRSIARRLSSINILNCIKDVIESISYAQIRGFAREKKDKEIPETEFSFFFFPVITSALKKDIIDEFEGVIVSRQVWCHLQ